VSTVRPLRREDVLPATRLYERVFRGGHGDPPPELVEFFDRVLFDYPWVDPDIPPLAVIEDERVVAFLGSCTRRMRLDARPVRLAVSGPLVVDPTARRPALGALLLRAYLRGGQELTVTDGGTELMRAIWERAGGDAAHLRCIEWVRPLRPFALVGAYVRHRRGRRGAHARASGTVIAALDRAAAPAMSAVTRLAGSRAQPLPVVARRPSGRGVAPATARPVLLEPLTPAALVEHLPRLTSRLRLAPAYDLPFAQWLLAEMGRVPSRGRLVARVVHRASRVIGIYVYYLQPGGLSLVVHVSSADESATTSVVDALVRDADEAGAAALHGRMETNLVQAVAAAGAFMIYGGNALLHAPDPAVAALATSPHALLTRLEGERWMAPHLF
jgi:hypothetical protein